MRDEASPHRLRLGLIGDNIRASRSPDLHRICGELNGIDVSYDLYIPPELGLDFEATFRRCMDDGLAGFNVTLPYKERVMELVTVEDPDTAQIGAVNTVRLGNGMPRGFNTDHTGFMAAYRSAFGDAAPGRVALIGAGGVGKAIAFALLRLGATELRVVDKDLAKARALASTLAANGTAGISVHAEADEAIAGADGVVNCTPLGMTGYPGSPLEGSRLNGQSWAFDAVYTPVDTLFRVQVEAAGLKFLSGYELFFFQGVHAFEIFTGIVPGRLDELRAALADRERAGPSP